MKPLTGTKRNFDYGIRISETHPNWRLGAVATARAVAVCRERYCYLHFVGPRERPNREFASLTLDAKELAHNKNSTMRGDFQQNIGKSRSCKLIMVQSNHSEFKTAYDKVSARWKNILPSSHASKLFVRKKLQWTVGRQPII